MDLPELAITIRDVYPDSKERVVELLTAALNVSKIRCGLQEELARRRAQYLFPQEKGKTELDRKISLDASVADIERDYEFARRLETIVDLKLELAKIYHD